MKTLKYIVSIIIVCFFIAACKNNPVDKALVIINNATERVEKCKSYDEVLKVSEETGDELKKLNLTEEKLSPEEQKELSDALVKYMQACMKHTPINDVDEIDALQDSLEYGID